MPKLEDTFTTTVDGAAAFERWRSEPGDERPSLIDVLDFEDEPEDDEDEDIDVLDLHRPECRSPHEDCRC